MDTSSFLDNLLASGRSLAERGKVAAEERLAIPESGPERDAMLSGMGKGALAAGALAVLLGTQSGRKVTGGVIKLGSLAALGGLAFKTYKDWQRDNQSQSEAVEAISEVAIKHDDERSRLILSAMIAAAKADGHIDDHERGSLQNYIDNIGESESLSQFVESELAKPLDPADLANQVKDQETAAEVYLASLLIIDQTNFMAKTYLSELVRALALPAGLVANLNREVDPV